MLDDKPDAGARDSTPDPNAAPLPGGSETNSPGFDASIVDELAALIDDGKTFAQAEVAFQKTRATLAGKNVGMAVAVGVVAVVLLHIALLGLAVGLVIALQPVMAIWGAITIVVGVLLIATALLVRMAVARGKLVAAMFAANKDGGDA